MAKVEPSREVTESGVMLITWKLKSGDTAEGFGFARACQITATAAGDFNGAKLAVTGSNDGAEYHSLADPRGEPIGFSKPGIGRIDQYPESFRPELTGGNDKTAVTLTLAIRRH